MKLIYAFIREYKNIQNQEIVFCPEFHVEIKDGLLFVHQRAKEMYRELLPGNQSLQNLHLIVGKTGSGKSNILNLIGMDYINRINQPPNTSFFLLYHKSDNQYGIELCNYSFKNDTDDKRKAALRLGYQSYSFSTNENDQACSFTDLSDRTVIFNGYDKHSFSSPIYSDDRNRKYDTNLFFLSRVNVPYQNTDLFFVCQYLSKYINTFDPNSDKKNAALTISSKNWSENSEDFLPEKLVKSDYFLYNKHYLAEELNNRDDSKNIVSRKKCFINDLTIDFALYLRGIIERNKLYLTNNPSIAADESKVPRSRKRRLTKHFAIDPNILPDYKKMPAVFRILWLAAYIDRRTGNETAGPLFKTAKNIQRIIQVLEKFDDKYFTYDTFVLPISDVFSPENNDNSDKLFYNIEQYDVPTDAGVFDVELLPYKLTCISSGEHQLARVFGSIEKYCFDLSLGLEPHDVIYILDEPEIYMHPELCRCFINRIDEILTEHETQLKEKNIQIIISTHSPFMLSDVMPYQITRLNCLPNGKCEINNGSSKKYFGANIHTIMADSFFLDYTIGEYSRSILQSMMDQLKEMLPRKNSLSEHETKTLSHIKAFVPEIGDTFIRKSFEIITEMFE